jgi:hypothetical protein
VIDASAPPSPRAEPLLRAQLESTPLAHVLVVAHDRQLTGSAVFQATSGESVQIGFVAGEPVKARASGEVARLGEVLVDLGLFSRARLARSLTEMAVLRRLLGELLIEDGSLTPPQLHAALGAQLRRRILHAAAMRPDTSVAFYERVDLMAGWGGRDFVAIDPLPIVLAAVRAGPPWKLVASALSRIGDKAIQLSGRTQLERFGLTDDQAAAAARLASPTTTRDWIDSSGPEPREMQLLLYALLITKQVVVSGTAETRRSIAPGLSLAPAPGSSAPPPPPDVTPSTTRASQRPPPVAARPTIEAAEKLLDAQRVGEAEAACREILAFEPKNGDALAMLVWLEAIKAGNESAMSTERAITSLTRIIGTSPNSWRASFFRGLLYKRAGDPHSAARDFQRVVTLSPQHEAANAEVRFYRMRVQRGSLPPPRTGR